VSEGRKEKLGGKRGRQRQAGLIAPDWIFVKNLVPCAGKSSKGPCQGEGMLVAGSQKDLHLRKREAKKKKGGRWKKIRIGKATGGWGEATRHSTEHFS